MNYRLRLLLILVSLSMKSFAQERPRVIVTTDGEADDRASMVRFLLYTNDFDVEAIVNSSSQFHWQGGQGWNALHPVAWIPEYIDLYAKVYPNLKKHDKNYPTPAFLKSKWKVGNILAVSEDDIRTEGAKFIAQIILDQTDNRPIWLQAWGGTNTISRALKIIQEDHPEMMEYAANKIRLFLIWEQDDTYQTYIRPQWEKLDVFTIISDQFDCMAYIWNKVLPKEVKKSFEKEWIKKNILKKGALCEAYKNNNGQFNAEGDTPSFLHVIPNGLMSFESPNFGGWGGRYINIRNNVWMDPAPSSEFIHSKGRVTINNSWSKQLEFASDSITIAKRTAYFKPIWRWLTQVQNDFANRASWCINSYENSNHYPVVKLKNNLIIETKNGELVKLNASKSTDPDKQKLNYKWWHYNEADSYEGKTLPTVYSPKFSFQIPDDASIGETIHFICEVSDSQETPLVRYKRVIIKIIP